MNVRKNIKSFLIISFIISMILSVYHLNHCDNDDCLWCILSLFIINIIILKDVFSYIVFNLNYFEFAYNYIDFKIREVKEDANKEDYTQNLRPYFNKLKGLLNLNTLISNKVLQRI